MNGGYTPYQLNKTEKYDHYYKDYKWNDDYSERTYTGKYNKHVCVRRIKIDNEYDRINYLITFCLKNYYINQANEVKQEKYTWSGGEITDNSTGSKYVHEQHAYWNKTPKSVQVTVDGHRYKVI